MRQLVPSAQVAQEASQGTQVKPEMYLLAVSHMRQAVELQEEQ